MLFRSAAASYEAALEVWKPAYLMASDQCAKAIGIKSANGGLSDTYSKMLIDFSDVIKPLCDAATTARRLLWNSAGVTVCGNSRSKTDQLAQMLSDSSDELKVKAYNCRTANELEEKAWAFMSVEWAIYKEKRGFFFDSVKAWNEWVAGLEPLATAEIGRAHV